MSSGVIFQFFPIAVACEFCSGGRPVESMAPAAVEVDLRGDARAAAGELQTGCRGGKRSKSVMSHSIYAINILMGTKLRKSNNTPYIDEEFIW